MKVHINPLADFVLRIYRDALIEEIISHGNLAAQLVRTSIRRTQSVEPTAPTWEKLRTQNPDEAPLAISKRMPMYLNSELTCTKKWKKGSCSILISPHHEVLNDQL